MKPKNQLRLLEPIQKLTCLHIEDKVSLMFDVFGGIDILGAACGDQIKIFACQLVANANTTGRDLGDYAVKVLAHEFRHVQQLNFKDLPQVADNNRRIGMGLKPAGYSDERYYNDPGEVDARDFADYMVKAMKAPYKKKLARLFRWINRQQYHDWYPFILNRYGE